MREALRSQRGFTLPELMVALAVTGLVCAGIFVIQQQGQQAYVMGSNRIETQQTARVALEEMIRELRSAQSVTALTSATDLTFVNESGVTIRYQTSGTTLNRIEGGVTTPLIGGVQALTMTYYSVFNVQTNTYTTTATPNAVRVIKVVLETKTEESAGYGSLADRHALVESTVRLRNL